MEYRMREGSKILEVVKGILRDEMLSMKAKEDCMKA